MEETVRMTGADRRRFYVIGQVAEGKVKVRKAVELLGISKRQVLRLVKRFKQEGVRGILHRSRGKESNRKIKSAIRRRVLSLYRQKYQGFGPTLAAEKLEELDKIKISDETLRLWLLKEGIVYRRRRRRPHRQWRARKEYSGEMVQMDGSHHDWLEARGPRLVLMAIVDDATGYIYARFYDYEGTIPSFDVLGGYIQRRGIPASIYLDKHTTYKSSKKLSLEEELKGVDPGESQFERAMRELGVKVIHANSPQAKGRVERLFRTFQDRVVKEMRLRAISSKKEANVFLRRYLALYNRRFQVGAAKKEDLHRPIGKDFDLKGILCMKTERFLRNDFTIIHNRRLYQVDQKLTCRTVTVEDRIDGSMRISSNGQAVKYHRIDAKVKQQKDEIRLPRKKPKAAAENHPWKLDFKRQIVKKYGTNTYALQADAIDTF